MLAKLVQEIVNITSEVIVHDVLIADKDGMVLGSRDVGKFLLGGTPHAHQAKRTRVNIKVCSL
ncbi:hypothetical protein ABGT22_09810 [Peribacillus frigoritolerans]|uniref:hypothetical protein n=1 Tax=Peribacillus frigoritolerans TaxID=450367 RepID=UPI00345D88A8